MHCDYCGEGDSEARGQVQLWSDHEGDFHMHAGCWTRYQQDQRKPRSR